MNGKFAWVGGVTNPDSRDAEVEALRAENEKLREVEDSLSAHIVQLAAERDALVVENEKLRAEYRYQAESAIATEEAYDEKSAEAAGLRKSHREAAKRLRTLVAERDALRAQLDNMTVETRRATRGPYYTDDFQIINERRLVGPWTAVEGGN